MFYDIYLYTLCYCICCLLGACMRCTRLCSLNFIFVSLPLCNKYSDVLWHLSLYTLLLYMLSSWRMYEMHPALFLKAQVWQRMSLRGRIGGPLCFCLPRQCRPHKWRCCGLLGSRGPSWWGEKKLSRRSWVPQTSVRSSTCRMVWWDMMDFISWNPTFMNFLEIGNPRQN